jgi:hypothetical protein
MNPAFPFRERPDFVTGLAQTDFLPAEKSICLRGGIEA